MNLDAAKYSFWGNAKAVGLSCWSSVCALLVILVVTVPENLHLLPGEIVDLALVRRGERPAAKLSRGISGTSHQAQSVPAVNFTANFTENSR
jgi:hypothetical protein